MKALKKIQIDIRRNIPSKQIRDGPVIRDLGDPMRFVLPRRHNEGSNPMFARDDIVVNSIDEDEAKVQKIQINVAPLEEYEKKLSEKIVRTDSCSSSSKVRERSRSPRRTRERTESPLGESDNEEVEDAERTDVRARLGSKLGEVSEEAKGHFKERRDVRERLGLSAKDRLGGYYRGRGRGRGGYRGHRGRKSDFGGRGRSDDWKYEHEEPSSTTD